MNHEALVTLATISGEALVNNLVSLVIFGLIIWLLVWLVGYVALGEPFTKIAKALIAVAAVIFLIYFLVNFMTGKPFITW